MSLQAIFDTAFTEKIVTPEMEYSLNKILWSHQFDAYEMKSLAILTEMLESGEITVLSA
ncbi:hypothetical protein Lepto7376_1077 [[Leptolyngbya] sp. PCC 7376]|uniref:hypothetical protein n=1 Tax=[Leptolyngbya] sp. PCC 7376 TaxID=111781 RepID=UPI00029EE155|nr:hypothetical protein [[Leptolyngbya] sp. PCC 7376]AFY37447.1 hypothetical protein Lepto7376_1077 [[Leptolyngbya] sp. PCC 7376]